ncbi:MAG TPA: prolyl oligopeptidase family serine peptidase, partial [Polyangiaceae bacterium]
ALAALTANDPTYQPGFEKADTSLQGAVCFYGVYSFLDHLGVYPKEFTSVLLERLVMKARVRDSLEAYRAASPIHRVHESAPPMLIVHGDRDTLAPVEYARHFAEELRKVSTSPVLYAELAGAQHAFDVFNSPRTMRVIEGTERFLTLLHRSHVRERDDGPARDPAPG